MVTMRDGSRNFEATGVSLGRAAVWATALCFLVFASPSAAARSAQEIEAAAARTIKLHGIQTDLPKEAAETGGWTLSLPDIDIVTLILWCAIAFGVVFVLYPLRDQVIFGRMRRPEDWDGQTPGANGKHQESQLVFAAAQADEFAAQGRYREAIHLLLLHALNEMRQRLKAQFADSLTSREIVRSAKLPDMGDTALRDVIGRVETSYFGEHPTGAEDYAACRASFDIFQRSLNGGGSR